MKTHGKKLLIIAFLAFFTFLAESLMAQGHHHRGGRPDWAPAHGQRAKMKARHIYFPEYNFYYDLHRDAYIYLERGAWRISIHRPRFLRYIDMGNSIQVALVLNSDTPFYYNRAHRRGQYHDDFDRRQNNGQHRGHHKRYKG